VGSWIGWLVGWLVKGERNTVGRSMNHTRSVCGPQLKGGEEEEEVEVVVGCSLHTWLDAAAWATLAGDDDIYCCLCCCTHHRMDCEERMGRRLS
jgi:hypothetical protein